MMVMTVLLALSLWLSLVSGRSVSFVSLIRSLIFLCLSLHWSMICSSFVRSLFLLCSISALPLFVIFWLSLSPLNSSLTLHFLLSTSIFSALGIWGKQDGTSNCAWGGRGRHCSSLVSGSPQPPPRCHTSPLSFQLISTTAKKKMYL